MNAGELPPALPKASRPWDFRMIWEYGSASVEMALFDRADRSIETESPHAAEEVKEAIREDLRIC